MIPQNFSAFLATVHLNMIVTRPDKSEKEMLATVSIKNVLAIVLTNILVAVPVIVEEAALLVMENTPFVLAGAVMRGMVVLVLPLVLQVRIIIVEYTEPVMETVALTVRMKLVKRFAEAVGVIHLIVAVIPVVRKKFVL